MTLYEEVVIAQNKVTSAMNDYRQKEYWASQAYRAIESCEAARIALEQAIEESEASYEKLLNSLAPSPTNVTATFLRSDGMSAVYKIEWAAPEAVPGNAVTNYRLNVTRLDTGESLYDQLQGGTSVGEVSLPESTGVRANVYANYADGQTSEPAIKDFTTQTAPPPPHPAPTGVTETFIRFDP